MLFLLWVLLLTFSSFSLVNRFFRQDEPAEKLLHLLVIFYGLLLVSFTLLGCFHWLKPLWITLSFFVFSLLSGLTGRLSLKKNDGPALTLVGQIAIAFTVCVFLMVVDFQSFLPPLTTDGLLYHLPFAAHYLQTASLSYPPLFFHDIAMTYYPHGGDLLYAFSLFSQNEHLLRFTQLPMVVIASLALYQLMKNQGFSRETSILGACLFSLVRPVAGQTFSCFVDLMLTAWFFSVVYYFSTGQGRKVCLGLVAAGLLISTKNFALIYFLLTLPLFFRNRPGQVRLLLSGLLFFLFIGGFSYWRNLILSGNPFFPASISMGKWPLLPGIYVYERSNFFRSVAGIIRLFLRPTSLTDPAPASSFLLAAGWLIGLVDTWRSFPGRRYLLLLPLLMLLLYAAVIPPVYHQLRHLLPIYGLFVFGLMAPLDHWPIAKVLLLPVFLAFTRYTVPVAAWTKLAVFFLLAASPVLAPDRKKRLAAFFLASLLIIAYFAYWRFPLVKHKYKQIRQFTWAQFYPDQAELWAFVSQNCGQGKTIAYAGQFLLYPLYGQGLTNRVYYQSVNSLQTRLIHEYPRHRLLFPAQFDQIQQIYRENPDFATWLEGLNQHQTDWVILRKDAGLIESAWILEHPDCFHLLWENQYVAVYRFSPARMIRTARKEKPGRQFSLLSPVFWGKVASSSPECVSLFLENHGS